MKKILKALGIGVIVFLTLLVFTNKEFEYLFVTLAGALLFIVKIIASHFIDGSKAFGRVVEIDTRKAAESNQLEKSNELLNPSKEQVSLSLETKTNIKEK